MNVQHIPALSFQHYYQSAMSKVGKKNSTASSENETKSKPKQTDTLEISEASRLAYEASIRTY